MVAKSARNKARPGKRLRAESRREIILDAAKRLFVESGYGATSIDQIAAAAGVTKPVVYDHFASKRDLYLAVMQRMREALAAAAAAKVAREAPPEQRLRSAVEVFFEAVKKDPAFVQILFLQPRSHPDLAEAWNDLQAELLALMKPLARQLAPRLKPLEIDVAIQFFHYGLNAVSEIWPKTASVEAMTDLIMSFVRNGFANAGTLRAKKRRAA